MEIQSATLKLLHALDEYTERSQQVFFRHTNEPTEMYQLLMNYQSQLGVPLQLMALDYCSALPVP